MTEFHEKPIYYKSEQFLLKTENTGALKMFTRDGLTWTSYLFADYTTTCPSCYDEEWYYLAWKFEWDHNLIFGFAGNLCVSWDDEEHQSSTVFHVEITGPGEFYFEQRLKTVQHRGYIRKPCKVHYELDFNTICEEEPVLDLLTAVRNIGLLIVDGKSVHVNKELLASHSEYFRSLFFSEFKEIKMKEIPIEDVSYKNFVTLLRVIDPNPIFPDDDNVEQLLEYASRFLMPAVISHVEHHLLVNSKLRLSRILFLADKYDLSQLFDKCISLIKSVKHVKIIHRSPFFMDISDNTKSILLDRMCRF